MISISGPDLLLSQARCQAVTTEIFVLGWSGALDVKQELSKSGIRPVKALVT